MTSRLRLMNESGNEIASSVVTADSFFARAKGLLGRSSLPTGEGLWIKRCNSIHTAFMKFPIDVVFVDDQLKVVSVHKSLKPWRLTFPTLRASSVFELPAGTLNNSTDITIGERLGIKDGGSDAG